MIQCWSAANPQHFSTTRNISLKGRNRWDPITFSLLRLHEKGLLLMVWLAGTRGVLSSTCQLISCFLPCVQIFFRMSWCGNIAARWPFWRKVCDHLFDIFDPNPPFMGNYTPWGLPLLYGSPSVQLVRSACVARLVRCSGWMYFVQSLLFPMPSWPGKKVFALPAHCLLFWSEFLTFICE